MVLGVFFSQMWNCIRSRAAVSVNWHFFLFSNSLFSSFICFFFLHLALLFCYSVWSRVAVVATDACAPRVMWPCWIIVTQVTKRLTPNTYTNILCRVCYDPSWLDHPTIVTSFIVFKRHSAFCLYPPGVTRRKMANVRLTWVRKRTEICFHCAWTTRASMLIRWILEMRWVQRLRVLVRSALLQILPRFSASGRKRLTHF